MQGELCCHVHFDAHCSCLCFLLLCAICVVAEMERLTGYSQKDTRRLFMAGGQRAWLFTILAPECLPDLFEKVGRDLAEGQ